MQELIGIPRDDLKLTELEVFNTLVSASVVFNYGIDVLDDAGNILFSPLVSEITVKMDATSVVPGTMDAVIGYRPAVTDRLRPWLLVSAGGITTRWWLGVFLPETPETVYGTTPLKWRVSAYDYLSALNKPLPRSRMANAGERVFDLIEELLSDAEFPAEILWDTTRTDAVTDVMNIWPADGSTTWLEVLDELLASISYRAAWMDWRGRLRIGPYIAVKDRKVAWDFNVNDKTTSISTDTPKFTRDVYQHPNRWTFVARGITSDPVEGFTQYTYDNVARGPSSQRALGKVNEAPPITLSAASYEDLEVRGKAEVDKMIRASETLEMTSRLLPWIWLDDVAMHRFANRPDQLIACQEWTMRLDSAQQMTSTWEVAQ